MQKKIEKSDATVADPKKAAKATVWLERGALFTDVALTPVKGVYENMPVDAANVIFSNKPARSTKKVGEENMTVLKYPYFEAYVKKGADGKEAIAYYVPRDEAVIDKNAPQKAYDAYAKAYEIDPKISKKVAEGLNEVMKLYKGDAGNAFGLKQFDKASKSFYKAYEVQLHPSINAIDTASIYNAGYLATVAGNWDDGLNWLKIAYDLGDYNNGVMFTLLNHCYMGKKDYEGAKKILFEGLEKYPANVEIIGGLINVYNITGEDPSVLVPMAQKAVNADPKNPILWSGLGRIYYALNQPGKGAEAFEKVVQLTPNDYDANFNLGLLYYKEAEAMQDENLKKSLSPAENEAARTEVLNTLAKAFPCFEKALQLKSNDLNSVDFLRIISFRLRDRAGMTDNFNKYKAIYDELQAKQPATADTAAPKK